MEQDALLEKTREERDDLARKLDSANQTIAVQGGKLASAYAEIMGI